MATVVKSKNDMEEAIEVKYVPLASNYKGTPLVASVSANGKISKAILQPHRWQKVSVALAKELRNQVKRFNRPRRVPDGANMYERMGTSGYEQEGGMNAYMREEHIEPDYEIEVRGSL